MAGSEAVPTFKEISPSMRVDVLIADWKAAGTPETTAEERERELYASAFQAYHEGDYGFGLWCWFECDRLANAFKGGVRDVTRILGPGRYLGFSHRRAIAEKVPVERLYRPRKGDMSTPRTDAFVLPHYQVLCVYAVRAVGGDPKAKAQLDIALGELEERRRADPFLKHFETFRTLLQRAGAREASAPSLTPPTAGTGTRRTPRDTKPS